MEIRDIFKTKFELPRGGFYEPVDLQDTELGFSVYKDQKHLGRDDFKSIFKVYIRKDDFKKEGDKKPVTITVSYGRKTGDGIIVNTSDFSDFKRELNWPVELISRDDFFYNINTHDFYHGEKIISAARVLDLINEWHIKPTKKYKGFWLRMKMRFFHTILSGILKILFYIVSGIQYLASGEKVNFYFKVEDSVTPKNKLGKKIKIFEYEVELWIAVLYSIFHLLIYSIFFLYNFWPSFLINIFHNGFLTVIYTIVSLGFADAVLSKLPKVYFTRGLLSFIQEKYYEMISKEIKI